MTMGTNNAKSKGPPGRPGGSKRNALEEQARKRASIQRSKAKYAKALEVLKDK
jgi:hypothetical protein